MMVDNLFPDMDAVRLHNNDYEVLIERDEDGKVWVRLEDKNDGGTIVCVLGEPGYTEKL